MSKNTTRQDQKNITRQAPKNITRQAPKNTTRQAPKNTARQDPKNTTRQDSKKATRQVHNFPPVFNTESRVLILGSFPSVKSREAQFFYGHPQNRFWKVIAGITGEETPQTIPEKRALLLAHHIALWDVIASCDIEGSSDTSIRNVEPNHLSVILEAAPQVKIFCNGAKSHELYQKYLRQEVGKEAGKLPSTSPANAAWTLEKLQTEWRRQLEPWLASS